MLFLSFEDIENVEFSLSKSLTFLQKLNSCLSKLAKTKMFQSVEESVEILLVKLKSYDERF